MTSLTVKKGHSLNQDEVAAIEEIKEKIYSEKAKVYFLFIGAEYDFSLLGPLIKKAFSHAEVVACSTSGEISDIGYSDYSLSGFSLSSERLSVKNFFIKDLDQFDPVKAKEFAGSLDYDFSQEQLLNPGLERFGFLTIDGLSFKEEDTAGVLSSALGGIPFTGGSAADHLLFKETLVYHDGCFHRNCAVFSLFTTDHQFKLLKTQHFSPVDEVKMVVTSANTHKRVAYEINGMPAATEYARLIGVKEEDLGPDIYSAYPLMLKIGGEYYIRSIKNIGHDGSISFFCSVEEGIVLTLAKGDDIVGKLDHYLEAVEEEFQPKVILGCECVLRKKEVQNEDLVEQSSLVMRRHNVMGFHTYGEQLNGLHINQTFTGIAFGD